MTEEKQTIKTDMNDRERERFAKELRGISDAATKAAVALDSRDDAEFVMRLMILTLISGSMKEMVDVVMTTLKKPAEDSVLGATEIA